MADYLLHYTSRVAAQLTMSRGFIQPGRAFVYLADELFRTAAEAADRLAIPVIGPDYGGPFGAVPLTKPIEFVCCIPMSRIDPNVLTGPTIVEPLREPGGGRVLYLGGGREYRYAATIEAGDLAWVTLSSP